MKKLIFSFLLLSVLFLGCENPTSKDADSDITAPSALEVTAISYGSDSVTIEWTMPTESDFSYVEVSYSNTSLTSTGTSAVVSSLNSDTEYTFTLVSVDTTGNESDDVSLTFTTSTSDSITETSLTMIETAAELADISSDLSGSYILMNDIDLSASSWTPIGESSTSSFTGKLFGNNHVVSNLTISSTADYQGLFGYILGATISQLGLEDLNIAGGECVGGLAGYNAGGEILYCYATGTVTGSGVFVGGLVGYNNGTISNCYATGTVTGGFDEVGGLVGYNVGEILYSYATAAITGGEDVGGLAGTNDGSISYCYATGTVEGDLGVGGLVGYNFGEILYCYATGTVTGSSSFGGLVGDNDYGTISECYYDSGTTGCSDTNGGTTTSTADMKTSTTYSDWDFTSIWDIDSDINSGYPSLQDNEPSE
jgi:hypothetical protein